MSSYYGLIVSEYRHYDYEKQNDKSHTKLLPTANSILSQYDSSPPSYSAVLAEKYYQQQQCGTWDQKLGEINNMLRAMKQSMHETQVMMKSFQYCCQKLKFKNQSLLTELQQRIVSFSEMDSKNTVASTNSIYQSEELYQQSVNDSLTRMNLSLEKLIEEAEMSLNTRLSLHADPHLLRRSRSCPKFTTKRNESIRRNSSSLLLETESDDAYERERLLKSQQQKRRYFHSQWKLAIAMKKLVQTVQKSTTQETKLTKTKASNNNVIVHHHIHHHYHHVYHHYDDKIKEIDVPVKEKTPEVTDSTENKLTVVPNKTQEVQINPAGSASMMRRDSSSLSSLFKYAFHTAAGMISEPPSPVPSVKSVTKRISHPVKIRTVFVATVMLLQKYNKTTLWMNRGNYLLTRWNKISKQQCNLWIRNSHLLHLVIQLVALSKK